MKSSRAITAITILSRSRRPLASMLIATLLIGCNAATTKKTDDAAKEPELIAFPPPPEAARYYYEGTLASTSDITPLSTESRLRRLLTGEGSTGEGFGKPFDVVACKGKVYISDTVLRAVRVFDFPGKKTFDFEDEDHPLAKPMGLAADENCNIYVADASQKQIMVFDQYGKWKSTLAPKMFNRLSHVAVTPDGSRLFAVDTGGVSTNEHRVRVFDVNTNRHLYDIGERGTGEVEFNLPRDIEIGPNGNLYIVDGGNFRLQVLTQDGEFIRSIGQIGRQLGMFSRPKGVAIDSNGLIYASDAAFGNFQIFNQEGQLLLFVGGRSSRAEPAKYMLPAGIDIDEDGRIFMVGQYFRKVDIFRPASLVKEDGYIGVWYGERPSTATK